MNFEGIAIIEIEKMYLTNIMKAKMWIVWMEI